MAEQDEKNERPENADATLANRTTKLPDDASGAAGPAAAPRLSDVTDTFGGYVRARAALVLDLARRHRFATVLLALIAAVGVASLALAFARAGAVPDDETIASYARECLETPAYSGGPYAASDLLVLREVDVRSVERSATAPERVDALFGASGFAVASVVVRYEGSTVSAERGARLAFALVDETWEGIGLVEDQQLAWHATAGVSEEGVLSGVDGLLERAEDVAHDAGGDGVTREMTLAQIYEGAEVVVGEPSFDEETQTDALPITFTREGVYESYTCQMTASFAFRQASGRWELTGVEVADGSKQRSFDPLIGAWSGTFQSQETDGTKCLGAREAGLAVVVEDGSTTDGVTTITGTISGLAHYHAHPEDDAQGCEGDVAFAEVPFSATLVGGRNEATGSDLAFVATLPEDVGGTVTVTLGFGTADDPSRVVALVQTTYPHTGSFLFFPVEETLTYTDTFTLTRAE